MLKIRRSRDRLIFNMGIPIPGKTVFILRQGPGVLVAVPMKALLSSHYFHYSDVILGAIASQITGVTIVYSTVYSGSYQRKDQSSASLAFVRGIHR